MATLEIFPEEESKKSISRQVHLGSTVLLHNARWFIKVRWIVVAIFLVVGVVSRIGSNILMTLGIEAPPYWPWILAGLLTVTNIFFSLNVSKLRADSKRDVEVNIWLQIITDLVVITVLVHMIGSTDTYISFIYIFHIAMACIFFRPLGSLVVTLLASGMYLSVIVMEITGILAKRSIFASNLFNKSGEPLITIINAVFAVFIWLVTWYLVSTLSKVVRRQDEKLTEANTKLKEANREKTMQVLVTTHELKSPVAGIESLINLIKFKYIDEVADPIRNIIEKIEARSKVLRERINEILTLGNLKVKQIDIHDVTPVDINQVVKSVIKDIKDEADRRGVKFDIDIPKKYIYGNMEHLKILFSNIIMNAVLYSYQGGVVEIKGKTIDGRFHIYIIDHGIGIREDALPHIFEEYYRTKEGASFNKKSTGLGLAIVKEIAKNYGYTLKVDSAPNKGTTFEIIIPEKQIILEKRDVL